MAKNLLAEIYDIITPQEESILFKRLNELKIAMIEGNRMSVELNNLELVCAKDSTAHRFFRAVINTHKALPENVNDNALFFVAQKVLEYLIVTKIDAIIGPDRLVAQLDILTTINQQLIKLNDWECGEKAMDVLRQFMLNELKLFCNEYVTNGTRRFIVKEMNRVKFILFNSIGGAIKTYEIDIVNSSMLPTINYINYRYMFENDFVWNIVTTIAKTDITPGEMNEFRDCYMELDINDFVELSMLINLLKEDVDFPESELIKKIKAYKLTNILKKFSINVQ